MQENGVRSFVFSSSCTVYGAPKCLPLDETCPTDPASITNPYGRSKFMLEQILRDLHASDNVKNVKMLSLSLKPELNLINHFRAGT